MWELKQSPAKSGTPEVYWENGNARRDVPLVKSPCSYPHYSTPGMIEGHGGCPTCSAEVFAVLLDGEPRSGTTTLSNLKTFQRDGPDHMPRRSDFP